MVVHDGPGRGCEGREKSLSVRPTPTRWRLRAPPYLPEGLGVKPSSLARVRTRETLGFVRAAASLSSHSFLKVLLGTRRFRVLGPWWISSVGAGAQRPRDIVVFSSIRPLRHFFLFSCSCDVLP
jgi:hypothetical protein